ncbi:hypothetical protein ACFWQK_16060 [Brachybacterium paraconglomeratum]
MRTSITLDTSEFSSDAVAKLLDYYDSLSSGGEEPSETYEFQYAHLLEHEANALRVLDLVGHAGMERNLAWDLALEEAAMTGEEVSRARTRDLVTSDPAARASALRGLKQAIERSARKVGWPDPEGIYEPVYASDFAGLRGFRLAKDFATSLKSALEKQPE